MSTDSYFYLYDLEDTVLNSILKLPIQELDNYIYALICRFYPYTAKTSEYYKQLEKAYKSSFVLEKLYRTNDILAENYTAIYTRTGLIREVVLDLYSITPDKVAIH